MDLSGSQGVKHPSIFDAIFDFRSDKQIKLDFARVHSSRRKISFAVVLMGFQESLNIACLSRKTHGFEKGLNREEGSGPRNFFPGEKDGNGGGGEEGRK